jgi:hypothetical protein
MEGRQTVAGFLFEPKLDPNWTPSLPERSPRAADCAALQESLRVGDGIRTRDRRDHNPANPVPQGLDLAL